MNSDSPHILSAINDSFERLKADILKMASLARRNFASAVEGVFDRSPEACNDAIANDDEVDELERKIDRDGTEIIIRYNPYASDLRRVLGAMKLAVELERISDQAVNIARSGRKLVELPDLSEREALAPLADRVMELVDDAIRSFDGEDAASALQLKSRDREVDRLHRELIEEINGAMERNPGQIRGFMELIFVIRHIERIGDHAVNMGEDVVYIESATDVRGTDR